jgi:hypothetical protein
VACSVEKKSEYACPTCGSIPNVLANGKPEGFEVTRGTVTFYLCLECSQAWQNNMAQLMPFQVPRLVKRDE